MDLYKSFPLHSLSNILQIPSFHSFNFNDRVLHGVLLSELGHDVLYRNDRQRGQGSRMAFPVTNKAGFLSERLAANVANVRPLPRVDEHVLLLSSLPSERFAAHGAGERFHPGVHPHVRVQIPASEPLSASGAQHLLPGLVPGQMLLQILPGGHPSSADSTYELGLVMPVLHVGLQSVEILAEVAAHVAHYRRCVAVVLLHVMVQRFLYLELLAARVAGEIVIARVQTDVVVLQGTFVVALVLAYAAIVHLASMDLLHVGGQVTAKPESLRAIGTLVLVLLQVLGQIALLEELAPTVVALQTSHHALLLPSIGANRFHVVPFLPIRGYYLEVLFADPIHVSIRERIQRGERSFRLEFLAKRIRNSKTENCTDRVIVGFEQDEKSFDIKINLKEIITFW